jgi:mono/diheme cytochrome c family protein
MKRWLKGLGYVAGGLATVVLVALVGVYGFSEARYRKQYTAEAPALAFGADTAAVARGGHLANTIAGCVDCHGENLGGKAVFDVPILGRVYGLNLTTGRGGLGSTLTNADFEHAIRHGIGPTGRALKVMPATDYTTLSDEDVAAIVAHVSSRPAVDNDPPAVLVGPLGRTLMVAGKMPLLAAEQIDHARAHVASVATTPGARYGAYLVGVGCKGCHGPTLAGGKIATGDPSWPPAANLTPAGNLRTWTEEDFRRLLREGKRPNGIPVNEAMPVRLLKNLTDDEIHSIWLYLRSVPAAPTPGMRVASR